MAEIVDSKAGYETETKKTSKGNDYSVGRLQGSGEPIQGGEPDSNGPPFEHHPVNWVPGGDWEPTDPVTAAMTGITSWKIDTSGAVYPYRLCFLTSKTFNYTFYDETGDAYQCNVFVAEGIHYFDYNSNGPTIVSIAGR